MMKLFDLKNPFFKPLWIRILVTAVTLGWSVFEFLTNDPFWAILFGAVAIWCAYSFFFSDIDSSER
jgi:hypothetical protein